MKFILSISLNVLLLLVFTAATTSCAWACGGKDNCKKETTEHKTKCQKDCCKKEHSDSKKNKKGCCGDDCSCSPIVTIVADLPKVLFTDNANFYPIFCIKNAFFYKQASPESTIQDILQPPISVLAI